MADEATGGSKNSSASNCVLYLFLASFVFPVLLVLVLAVAQALFPVAMTPPQEAFSKVFGQFHKRVTSEFSA